MPSLLRHLYLMLVCAAALTFSAWTLVGVLHPLLLMAGFPDVIGIKVSGSAAYFEAITQDPHAPPLSQQFLAALPLFLVALIIVTPIFMLHYHWLHQFESQAPAARGSLARVVVLDLMTIGCGAVVVIAATNATAAWLRVLFGPTFRFYDQFIYRQAISLAVTLAFSLPLLLVLLERRRTQSPGIVARRISWSLLGLTQVVVLFQTIIVGGGVLQAILQASAAPATPCTLGLAFCHGLASASLTNSLGQALVALGALIGVGYLVRRDGGDVIGVARSMALLMVAMFFTIGFSGRWLEYVLTFSLPQPIFAFPNTLAFPYGIWLAALVTLGWAILVARHQISQAKGPWAARIILIGASVPPLGALVLGASDLISHLIAVSSDATFNDQSWNIVYAQLAAALPLLVNVPLLLRTRWHPRSSTPAEGAASLVG